MGKHLDRLSNNRIFEITKKEDGSFEIEEQCDYYFREKFTAEELRELAQEIIALSVSNGVRTPE